MTLPGAMKGRLEERRHKVLQKNFKLLLLNFNYVQVKPADKEAGVHCVLQEFPHSQYYILKAGTSGNMIITQPLMQTDHMNTKFPFLVQLHKLSPCPALLPGSQVKGIGLVERKKDMARQKEVAKSCYFNEPFSTAAPVLPTFYSYISPYKHHQKQSPT